MSKLTKVIIFCLIAVPLVVIILISEPTVDGIVFFTFDASAQGLASSGGRAGVSTGVSAGTSAGASAGGGGGGGSGSSLGIAGGIPQQPDFSGAPAVKISKNSHKISPNQEISSYFTIDWESDDKVIVRGIDVDDESNEYVFEDTPFTLNAFGFIPNKSNSKIFYKINISPEPVQTTTNNAVIVSLNLGGIFYTTETNIKLDVVKEFDILEFIKSFFARFRLSLSEQSLA